MLVCSCEKIDLSESDDSDDSGDAAAWQYPTSTGMGTMDSPLSVTQASDGTSGTAAWVIGYAVGSTKTSYSNATFSVPTTYNTCILLSDDAACSDASECIPVQLSSSIQPTLALSENPERHRQCVMVYGTLGRYFSRNGVCSVSKGMWLADFDLSTINPTPQEWSEK